MGRVEMVECGVNAFASGIVIRRRYVTAYVLPTQMEQAGIDCSGFAMLLDVCQLIGLKSCPNSVAVEFDLTGKAT